MDSYSQRFDSTTGRDSKSQKKKGSSNNSTSYYDDGDRKPKFVSMTGYRDGVLPVAVVYLASDTVFTTHTYTRQDKTKSR